MVLFRVFALTALWIAWIAFFALTVRVGIAFGEGWLAILPGLPIAGMTAEDWVAYTGATLLLWGSPLLLAVVSWRMIQRHRKQA